MTIPTTTDPLLTLEQLVEEATATSEVTLSFKTAKALASEARSYRNFAVHNNRSAELKAAQRELHENRLLVRSLWVMIALLVALLVVAAGAGA